MNNLFVGVNKHDVRLNTRPVHSLNTVYINGLIHDQLGVSLIDVIGIHKASYPSKYTNNQHD
ncbi:hypothetical protein D3C84_949560 [compost metagenome]